MPIEVNKPQTMAPAVREVQVVGVETPKPKPAKKSGSSPQPAATKKKES